ncbi:MAG: transcriptional regulator [Planctomycetes bacterium]|nr:transcriptional regulator [Planctomycetota bacterium]
MKKKPSVEDRIVQGLEEFADALESGKDIAGRFTCRTIVLNLEPSEYNKSRVRDTRDILGASQTIFAHFLGVSPRTVQAWERGEKTPMPIACRFMDEIRNDPQKFRRRFLELATPKTAS